VEVERQAGFGGQDVRALAMASALALVVAPGLGSQGLIPPAVAGATGLLKGRGLTPLAPARRWPQPRGSAQR